MMLLLLERLLDCGDLLLGRFERGLLAFFAVLEAGEKVSEFFGHISSRFGCAGRICIFWCSVKGS